MTPSSLISSLGENSRRYEHELRELQLELSSAHEQELRLQHSISSAFQQIANCHLTGGAQLTSEVLGLLEQRSLTEKELRDQLAVAEASVGRHLQAAKQIAEEIEAIVQGLDRQLEADPQYQQQTAALAEAVALCDGAAASYKELREECRSKLEAFQRDQLYLYLKECGFGTERYSRGTLLSELDRWIARLCNFAQNSAAEQTLLAMQEANEGARWQHEANRGVQEANLAQRYQALLAGTDTSVLQARLEKRNRAVELGKAQANAIHEQLDRYANRRDEHFTQAFELLSRQLAQMSLPALEQLAGQTTTPQDDELVQKVREGRGELEELQRRVSLLDLKYKEAELDYQRAKQLERDLLSGDKISVGSTYSEGMNLEALLLGFMKGTLSLSQVENEVNSHRQATTVVSGSWSISSTTSWSNSSTGVSGKSSSSGSFSATRSSSGGEFSTSDSR
ncbi:coiled-coil domain-containing protein [Pseudomonas chlororaphis]|uniref:hypothetical protein n=1 Tax=Pseudomonas chlororaphis TaxID=587753 RepID=UPI000BE3CC09|nr:hypothetical protein [Pseudomonas chlororaphis]